MPDPNGALYHQQLSLTPPIALMGHQKGGAAKCYLAGILPVHGKGADVKVYLTRPEARKPDLPPPLFQLGKGTRMLCESNAWRDQRPEDQSPFHAQEPLPVTALREGEEELGLQMENVQSLWDAGTYDFLSSTTGEAKNLALYLVSVHDPLAFHAPDRTYGKSAECQWLDPKKEGGLIKPDHLAIIEEVLKKLAAHEGGEI